VVNMQRSTGLVYHVITISPQIAPSYRGICGEIVISCDTRVHEPNGTQRILTFVYEGLTMYALVCKAPVTLLSLLCLCIRMLVVRKLRVFLSA